MATAKTKSYVPSESDLLALRDAISMFNPSASSAVAGEDRAKLDDVFAPISHGKALDPATTLVLGARGSGKSFWASVLLNRDTRELANKLYPRLGLERLSVGVGFAGIGGRQGVDKRTIDKHVPTGQESSKSEDFWRAVIAREILSVDASQNTNKPKISELILKLSDPEDWVEEMAKADDALTEKDKTFLILFDAIDVISDDWNRLSGLIDGLLRVVWDLRGFNSIRAKLFVRPDQLNELSLRFVELSKLRSGAARLNWEREDLFGMMFTRLALDPKTQEAFARLVKGAGLSKTLDNKEGIQLWQLSHDSTAQRAVFEVMAGPYMGSGPRKGRTYEWPYNHLADGFGEVTPRSFLILMQEAASRSSGAESKGRVLLIDAIRDGLRQASKVRIDQLSTEYPWIARVLLPLGGLRVPAEPRALFDRWKKSGTVQAATTLAQQRQVLPPIVGDGLQSNRKESPELKLALRLADMGVLTLRSDDRYDMPDLFRVGAALLKKGGVAPDR